MPRFFVTEEQLSDEIVILTGDDAHHIARSLRMAVGEHITVCDRSGREYDCALVSFEEDRTVRARVIERRERTSEPPYEVTVYQALPKGDKLDTVIQKAVECGACRIIPFESENCVVRVREDSEARKQERRARIAAEAAKQCGRGRLPEVMSTLSFDAMLEHARSADAVLFCYEGEGTVSLRAVLQQVRQRGGVPSRIAVIVGSEGGFSSREAEKAKNAGFFMTGLGPRILRTETAAAFVLGCLCYEFELSS